MKMQQTIFTKIATCVIFLLFLGNAIGQPTPTTPITAIVDLDGNGSRDYLYVIGADVWVDRLHNGTYTRFPGLGLNKIYNGVHQMDATARNEVLFIQEKLVAPTYTYTVSVLYTAVVNGPILKKTVSFTNTSRYGVQIRDIDANAGIEALFYNNASAQLYTFTPNTIWKMVPTYASHEPAPVTVLPFFVTSNLGPGKGVDLIFVYYFATRLAIASNKADWNYIFCRVYNGRTKALLTLDPGVVGGITILINNVYYNPTPCPTVARHFTVKDHVSATSRARMIFSLQEAGCPANYPARWDYTSYDLETGAWGGAGGVTLAAVNAARTNQEGTIGNELDGLGPDELVPLGNAGDSTLTVRPPSIIASNNGPTPLTTEQAGETTVGMIEKGQLVDNNTIIYPTITSGIVQVRKIAGETIKKITLTDGQGKVVYAHNGNAQQLDIGHLANGIYFYQVQTATGNRTGKLVKQ